MADALLGINSIEVKMRGKKQNKGTNLSSKAVENNLTKGIEVLLMLVYEPFWQKDFENKIRNRLEKVQARLLRNYDHAKQRYKRAESKIYRAAIKGASRTMLRREAVFPKRCPFTLRQVVGKDPAPPKKELPFRSWQIRNAEDLFSEWFGCGPYLEEIRPRENLKCRYFLLSKGVSNKKCTIIVVPPSKGSSVRNGVLWSVNNQPKILCGKSFPKKHFNDVQNFIRVNYSFLRNYWRNPALATEIIYKLKGPDGRYLIDRENLGSFTSRGETFSVSNSSSRFYCLISAKGYEGRIEKRTLRGEYFSDSKVKWLSLRKSVIDDFKLFIAQISK